MHAAIDMAAEVMHQPGPLGVAGEGETLIIPVINPTVESRFILPG